MANFNEKTNKTKFILFFQKLIAFLNFFFILTTFTTYKIKATAIRHLMVTFRMANLECTENNFSGLLKLKPGGTNKCKNYNNGAKILISIMCFYLTLFINKYFEK